MNKSINLLFTIVYYLLILLPIVYVIVATYSYYSVSNSFGQVPGNDDLFMLAKEKNIEINTFPIDNGELLIKALMFTYLIVPIVILINYLTYRLSEMKIQFQKYSASILIGTYVFVYFSLWIKPIGWYFVFVLD